MSTLRSIWKILSLRCQEASELMSKQLDEPLPFAERWALRLHASVCGGCRRLRRQIRTLRELLVETATEAGDEGISELGELSDQARARLQALVDREITEPGEPT